ncbi:hypothetical protein [Vibrio nigripulchritudo]|uniref:hypothetical protein n=1 Tax=Vibrio nigripulchritudo TaxID=28173 RepID=UPI0003B208FF|nr:hypothetical protein [Vibrio nigripulchritudo]CCN70202.1 hypothetical protein VIBNISFn118_1890004 [Vibrio nigripulchritudo SFn118]
MEKEVQELKENYKSLEARARKLENYWYVTLALAVILGFSGAFLGNELQDAKKKMETLHIAISNSKKEIDAAKLAALKELSTGSETAIKNFQDGPFNEWLKEERNQRKNTDVTISKWVKNIYNSAASNGMPKHEGANGWWQKQLISQQENASNELP